ncbi:hypothetical protein Ga0123462_1729 [Mariprofundus ferrinatatus]|uniref:Uncharacterized protein n=1 Tax=Mariprofundus ferrinatatus TaxID=1921087 RepID=A0A2K8L5L7_9PROT|nr:hypothetical protein [Mariprofundus ferrinatatus]ATX82577.1 hypothetical protein Ga0123462_1729 [Mariprofundus ferrinatatus]
MKLNKARPHAIPKDPEKAAAERLQKRKSLGSALLFFIGMGLAIWHLKSPDTFNAAVNYVIRVLQS